MKNFKFLLLLGVFGCFQLAGLADDLVIERPKKAPPADPSEWKKVEGTDFFTATFALFPEWLSSRQTDVGGEDPFVEGGGNLVPPKAAKEILESVGIPFPEGATAVFDRKNAELIARNTWENLELIQHYVGSEFIDPFPPKVAIRTEIYEVTPLQALQLQESAQAEADHKPERDAALRAVREGDAKLVATHSLVTTNGQRAKIEDVSTSTTVVTSDEKRGEKVAKLVERDYGTILEAEPNVDADNVTIQLNIALEHHTAAPAPVNVGGMNVSKSHRKSIQTNVNLLAGEYVLLATWKPTGKPEHEAGDLVHVVFLNASLQPTK